MVQQVIAIFLVLGLLGLALWLLRRQGLATFQFSVASKLGGMGRRQEKRLRVLERIMLTPHHSLYLVAFDGREMIVSASPNGCEVVNPPSFAAEIRNAASC